MPLLGPYDIGHCNRRAVCHIVFSLFVFHPKVGSGEWGLVTEKFFDSFKSFSTGHSKWSSVRIGLFFATDMSRMLDTLRSLGAGVPVCKLKLSLL